MVELEPLAKAAAALSKPLVKLIEVVESGVGAIGHPFMTVINAHADGRAALIREVYAQRLRLLKASNRSQIAALTPPKKAGEDLEIEVVFEEAELLAARATETEQQAKRRANVLTIAAEAADRMPGQVSEEPVDPDFAARFFTAAQDVSNADLQRLWGELLAKEVTKPGQVPLRTLELLRNLSPDEGRMFAQMLGRSTRGHIFISPGNDQGANRVIGLLVDAGLLGEYVFLQWRPISEGHPDLQVAHSVFVKDGYANVAYHHISLKYPSALVLSMVSRVGKSAVLGYPVRPSAIPLAESINVSADIEYLRKLVEHFNRDETVHAWIEYEEAP